MYLDMGYDLLRNIPWTNQTQLGQVHVQIGNLDSAHRLSKCYIPRIPPARMDHSIKPQFYKGRRSQ